ncbi:intradiol ring-cleavage dioxygenase [Bradyrhizobium embrapense]|uniref:intradiol ring-cleavage dioxygenase n=1 Tax=Bradyrhizobium embrapense TaxID=630921 RepID=UPI00067AB394|nr:intradiol ring-cleavage dioxygenase [Bradyrhizobium embrapense]
MSSGIIERVEDVTPSVLRAMSGTDNARLRTVLEALVKHLHAFAREVKLTEAEYDLGIDFLNRIGQATHDSHNEGILFADAVGFSTLVCLLNNGNAGATESAAALLGPFWRANSPRTENGGSIVRSATAGPELFVSCEVVDVAGKPVADAEIDVWQSSPVGLYENQDDTQADMNLRGKFTTDAAGRFSFRSVKPAGYPVPTDGPVGDMLRAQNRHPYRPAHIHFLGFKPGHKTLVTQIFVDDDEHLESDVVFGVTRALIGDYRRHDDGEPPAAGVRAPWYTLNYRFVMEAGEAILPKPPIK